MSRKKKVKAPARFRRGKGTIRESSVVGNLRLDSPKDLVPEVDRMREPYYFDPKYLALQTGSTVFGVPDVAKQKILELIDSSAGVPLVLDPKRVIYFSGSDTYRPTSVYDDKRKFWDKAAEITKEAQAEEPLFRDEDIEPMSLGLIDRLSREKDVTKKSPEEILKMAMEVAHEQFPYSKTKSTSIPGPIHIGEVGGRKVITAKTKSGWRILMYVPE